MRMRQVFGTLACGSVLLAGVGACSDDQDAHGEGIRRTVAPGAGQGTRGSCSAGIEQGQAASPTRRRRPSEGGRASGGQQVRLVNLGYLAQSRNATDEAVADYDKALQIDGSYRPALYNKAMLLEKAKPDEAVALYRKIVDADEGASTAYLRLG